MCEFCGSGKQIKLYGQDTDSNITDCFIGNCADGSVIFFRESAVIKLDDKGRPHIKWDNDLVYMDINYCPMCGRKLVD